MFKTRWVMGACLAIIGCNARVVELGGVDGGSRPATGTEDSSTPSTTTAIALPGDGGPFPGAALCAIPDYRDDASAAGDAGGDLTPLLGTWSGTATFPATSNPAQPLTLTFATQADGSVAGSILFGGGPAIAPPTSADTTYPPGFDGVGGATVLGIPYPDFAYTAVQVSFDGTHLSLGFVANELFKQWCNLQTSYASAGGACACLPEWGGMGNGNGTCGQTDPSTGQVYETSCALVSECLEYPVCSCWRSGCTVSMTTADATFALTLGGQSTRLDGTLASGSFTSPVGISLTLSP